ncbi:MAG TPA: Vms1/Ankzf1 family peptidyl-tRNA hydrolase [Gaiellaceae bacterium]
MAMTVTWDDLRELAGFQADQGYAVSLYLNLDPREAPTPAGVETRANSLISEASRTLEERKSSLSREAREALKGDVGRIQAWFDDGFDRRGLRGVAVFAAGLDNLWSTLSLPDPVADRVTIGGDLCLAPLARLAGRADPLLVAAVGRERGQVFRLRSGNLVEIADDTEAVPGRHDQGGWSQGRFERHIDELVEQHWRRVADTLDSCVRKLHGARVVLIGAEDMRSDFAGILSSDVNNRVLGWATADSHADATQLLDAVRPVLEEWWAKRDEAVIARWREESGKNGRAATGWEQTLEAASDGRAELLLVQDGVDEPAYQCPACGRAQRANGSCPLDGTMLESRESGLDLAVHKTLVHGGTVHVIRERRDLEPVGGVGALLRY